MKLSFMTFVCPDWDIETVVEFASTTDYDGVEIRVDSGHKHNVSSESPAEERTRVKQLFADAGVEIACLATSVHLANPDPEEHAHYMAMAKANIDLASDLGAPVMRIFAGGGMDALTPDAALQVAAAFDELGAYAKGTGVCPMLECGHDIIRTVKEAKEVIQHVTTETFGALWNHSTMDDNTFNGLKDHIRHFHIHKNVLDPEDDNVLGLTKLMNTIGYQGYASLEIIERKNLPEDLLIETGKRLKGFMQSV